YLPAASATTLRAASVKSVAGVMVRPLPASVVRAFSALVPSRRTTTGTFTPTFFTALITPSAMRSQRTMPPKMLTRTARTRIGQNELECGGHPFAGRSAAHIEKVCRLAAVQLDEVHGGHREARAVDHAGDVPIEGDIVQIVLARAPLHGIFLARIPHPSDVRVAEDRIGIGVDLGIERDQAAALGDDQRVDLDETGVLLHVKPIQPHADVLELADLGALQPEAESDLPALVGLQPGGGVN